MVLSQFDAAPIARLAHFPFAYDGAFPAQCGMSSPRSIDGVDVLKHGHVGAPARLLGPPPDQLHRDRSKKVRRLRTQSSGLVSGRKTAVLPELLPLAGRAAAVGA